MRRRAGYALSELLVAVAIAGLIIGVLTFLNVDYVSLARRATDFTRDQAEMLSGKVREQPLVAIMLAGAAGYLLGRLFR